MTGEDKMNRIFVYIGIIAGLLLGGSLSVEMFPTFMSVTFADA